ncbi:MAG: hypothetical protein ACFFD4_06750 [Candidatus Odinarchaeota archaeon]
MMSIRSTRYDHASRIDGLVWTFLNSRGLLARMRLNLNTFYGELGTAPMIFECPVNLECKVIKKFSIKHMQIFVGKVTQAYVTEEFVFEKDGRKGNRYDKA